MIQLPENIELIVESFEEWFKNNNHSERENYYPKLYDKLSQFSKSQFIDFFLDFANDGGMVQSGGARTANQFIDNVQENYRDFRNRILEPFQSDFDVDNWLEWSSEFKYFGQGIATIYLNRVDKKRFAIVNNKSIEAYRQLGYEIAARPLVKTYHGIYNAQKDLIQRFPVIMNFYRADSLAHFLIGETEGIALLENKPANYWIFQGSQSIYDTISALRDKALQRWRVTKHKSKIKVGDKVILWVTGNKAGCYALGTVMSAVEFEEDDSEELKYYATGSNIEPHDGVKLRIDHNLWNAPILKEQIAGKVGFEKFNAGISGTNFSATKEQYDSILNMITMNAITNTPLNQILYGPPGTGKTFNSVNHALSIIEGKAVKDIAAEIREDIMKRYDEYRKNGQIEFVTFHSNYSYEDFVEGIKPDVKQKTLSFDRVPGIFKRISERARQGLSNTSITTSDTTTLLGHDDFLNYIKAEVKAGNCNIKRSRAKLKILRIDESKYLVQPEKGNPVKPSIKDLKNKFDEWLALSEEDKVKFLKRTNSYAIHMVRHFGPLFIEKQGPESRKLTQEGKVYVMIIDEINRANISRVFGELITLIEPDKRIGEINQLKVTLPSGEEFGVPSNLYIIGTMNTADKSIALVDIALRRRFHFIPMYPDSDLIPHEFKSTLDGINKAIYAEKRSPDFFIGHSFFIGKTKADLPEIINNNIIPLLMEYFPNKPETVIKVLGEGKIKVQTDRNYQVVYTS